MQYMKFLEACPNFQTRVEALTNMLLSPDPKGLSLQAMEPSEYYNRGKIYKATLEFCNIGEDEFPLHRDALWCYYNGRPGTKGSLHKIGAVEKSGIKWGKEFSPIYRKTKFGEDFSDPAIARGTFFVNELLKEKKDGYFSLWKIFGGNNRPPDKKYGRGYLIYRIIKLLAANPAKKFREVDITKELPEIQRSNISLALNYLGEAGVIDYASPHIETEGKRGVNWAKYRASGKINFREAYDGIKKIRKKFRKRTALSKTCKFINRNLGRDVERNELSRELKINAGDTSSILVGLSEIGKLDATFQGGIKVSEAKANKYTRLFHEFVMEPVERLAMNPEPSREFGEILDFYQRHENQRQADMKKQLEAFNSERTMIGLNGGKEIRESIITVLRDYGKEMKLSHIRERVNQKISRSLKYGGVCGQLRKLEKQGKIRKLKKAYYRLNS